jgi:hypothetical protein
MTKDNFSSFYNVPGAQVPTLFSSYPEGQDGYVPVSFQVSYVANYPNMYIGVESEYSNSTGKWRAVLRSSKDMVNWSDPIPVPSTSGPGNANGQTNGEQFSIAESNDGSSNTVLSGYDAVNNTLPVNVVSTIGSVPYIQKLIVKLPK